MEGQRSQVRRPLIDVESGLKLTQRVCVSRGKERWYAGYHEEYNISLLVNSEFSAARNLLSG